MGLLVSEGINSFVKWIFKKTFKNNTHSGSSLQPYLTLNVRTAVFLCIVNSLKVEAYIFHIFMLKHYLIKRKSCSHMETCQLICRANQLSGFCMMTIFAFNELIQFRITTSKNNTNTKREINNSKIFRIY